jgi:putative thiamine transport system permease protein
MLRLFPLAALALLIVPVAAGLLGIALPAFGYFPALGGREFSLGAFHALFAEPGLFDSALLSFATGLAATAAAFGVVMLFVAGWRDTRAFRTLQRLVSPRLSVPHAAAAFGLAFLIAPSGYFFRLVWSLAGWHRPPDLLIVQDRLGLAMVLGLVVKEIPFLFLMTLAALPQTRAAEMARMIATLGYGRIVGFVHAVLPVLYRQLRLPVLAVLAFSTSVVDVALILGPTTPAPLSVRVIDWQYDPDLSMHFVAAAGAVLQVGVTGAALLVWLAGERVAVFLCRGLVRSGWRARRDAFVRGAAGFLMALSAAVVLAGLVLLVAWSFATSWRFPEAFPDGLTLATWMRFGAGFGMVLGDTLALACVSSLAATALALGALESAARAGIRGPGRALRTLYVPLIAPQVAFLFGLQILFAFAGFDGTFAALALVHLVFVFPYVLLSLSDPWSAWDPRYGLAVRALGHGADAVFWRVRLPMLARPVLVAAALGFAVSVALYLPTLLIGGGRWPTVTTEAVALASGGDPRLIGATALVQAVFPFLGFAVAAIVPAILFRNRRAMLASA